MTYADLLFANGPVLTMDTANPRSHALAVKDGRILALGDRALGLRGPGTQVIDLSGKALLPGFQDAHVHPLMGGLQMVACDLSEVHSLSEYRRIIANYARTHAEQDWVEGAGWYGDVFDGGFPHRDLLDELVPDRPAYFLSHDGHGAWVNTRALELAGITDSTPHPDGGIIAREENGRATGMLIEHAADLVSRMLPAPDKSHIRNALLEAQKFMHSKGITAWQDAAVGEALGSPDAFEHYLALDEQGLLTATVTGALWWHREQGLEQLELFRDRRSRARGRFRASAVKLMLDGVCENLTAAMTRPYVGHPQQRGMTLIEPEVLCDITRSLDAEGFDLHLHAVGDQAVRDSLSALELQARTGWDPRHQIAHLDIIDAGDIAQFSRVGAIANIQPLWARQDPVLTETKLPYLDSAHQSMHFAFQSLHEAGVPLAMGSDWPVSSPDPMWGVHSAVNRTAPPADPHAKDERSQNSPLLGHEAIALDAALHAATAGAAFANRLDQDRGTLREGMIADLAVLEADPYAVPARALGDLAVERTYVDGVLIFHRATSE
ncbi:peptidase M38 family protein [Arthrobacter sp. MYb211]|uniref:amidohydrolase n=1 Tax=unclassified Arthrobacter TaxID=235627 RepID=UPI000CFB7359|nr:MULTISPECIES: amidohydrolase [unclassified Arthrobacter]PRA12344.1 peptidase M38 family protein [Arthrobacter sp. MYb221]PRC08807.1 peptidase M38 family protein [Arthrobacter sp. MYb211]